MAPQLSPECYESNCTEQTNPWGKNRPPAGQKMPHILQKPQLHCRAHKSRQCSLQCINWVRSLQNCATSLWPILLLYAIQTEILKIGSFFQAPSRKSLRMSSLTCVLYVQRSWFHQVSLTPASIYIYKVLHYVIISVLLSLVHSSTPSIRTPVIYIYIYIYTYIYTECPRRNGQNSGRVFLMLKYTDITQNTYIQSWTVTEIMAREVWKFDSCYTLIDYQIHIKTGRNMWFL